MARKALGRGLDALIPGREGVEEGQRPSRLAEIDVDRIRPNPKQPRDRFDDEAIDAIAASLQEHGLLQPVVVRRAGEEEFELIAGERRWRAAQRAGLQRIPAVVRDADARQSLELALVENLQREDLNPVEEAQGYHLLIEDMGLTQEQVAAKVGKDRSTVANYLRLLKLPAPVQEMLIDEELTMGHARALLGAPDAASQRRIAERVVRDHLSVRRTESLVRDESPDEGGSKASRPRRSKDPDVAAAEEKLTKALGTPVSIRGRERGRLEIRFTSLDELNRIYELLLDIDRR